ncbi:helix-turn-helix domain-containing protein [Acinetobacter apis]|uniref:Transcriptional regulator, contains XRE-family HTH domain n=1 Tax=Acinetobacter apis TaxID=1229165 RepID=A0A217EHA7_9GAMM|nr:helix-turn-helix domain-containing protein [Acinetobacter apis]SNQ29889.1 Transcriptional regulator, contains XRE-family HTH domain [Acinetobacter apis]
MNKIKQQRLQHAWSQEQLAEMTALSVRTIQRVENGDKASLETLSALAAVFQVSVHELTDDIHEHAPSSEFAIDHKLRTLEDRVNQELRFYSVLTSYVLVCGGLMLTNYFFTPHLYWSLWPTICWGATMLFAWLRIFVFNQSMTVWKQKRMQTLLRK